MRPAEVSFPARDEEAGIDPRVIQQHTVHSQLCLLTLQVKVEHTTTHRNQEEQRFNIVKVLFAFINEINIPEFGT